MNTPFSLQSAADRLIASVGQVIKGKDDVIRKTAVCLFCGGHILLEDVPGTGKTTLAKALSRSIDGMAFTRVQFTPDLLPGDLTGGNIYNQKTQEFIFRPGPVFTNILLADEINRATPRTQSSLLECMEEGQVTVDGETRRLEQPFFVVATQNPVEIQGTFPLPEAQLDRFLMKLESGLPEKEEERIILERFAGEGPDPLENLAPVCGREELFSLQAAARQVYVHPQLMDYMVELVRATRETGKLEITAGVSPRGSLALLRSSRAYEIGRAHV